MIDLSSDQSGSGAITCGGGRIVKRRGERKYTHIKRLGIPFFDAFDGRHFPKSRWQVVKVFDSMGQTYRKFLF